MSPVTKLDFQSDLALHPKARALLAEYFDQGWFEPNKIHHDSARLRSLLATAKESIAAHLGLQPSAIDFVGELGMGFWIALDGLLYEQGSRFIYSPIDRQLVHAIARRYETRGGDVAQASISSNGVVDYSSMISPNVRNVISWQGTNRETGIQQSSPTLKNDDLLFADMTAQFPLDKLPDRWDVALWDPRTFAGPQGIGILAFESNSRWRNPAPSVDSRRTFGSFSKPLLLATAVALEEWKREMNQSYERLRELGQELRGKLNNEISGIRFAGDGSNCDPRFIAFALDGIIAEELLREMEILGCLIDAGSACGSGPLSPSHVFQALGLPDSGHIRLTLKPGHTRDDIDALVTNLALGVKKLRERD